MNEIKRIVNSFLFHYKPTSLDSVCYVIFSHISKYVEKYFDSIFMKLEIQSDIYLLFLLSRLFICKGDDLLLLLNPLENFKAVSVLHTVLRETNLADSLFGLNFHI